MGSGARFSFRNCKSALSMLYSDCGVESGSLLITLSGLKRRIPVLLKALIILDDFSLSSFINRLSNSGKCDLLMFVSRGFFILYSRWFALHSFLRGQNNKHQEAVSNAMSSAVKIQTLCHLLHTL